MTKKYVIAVIGATGNVGHEVLNYLAERKFPVEQIFAAASPESVGKQVSFGDDTLKILQLSEINFKNIDIAFFCTGSAISKKYAEIAAKDGCIVIDKSSYFRLNDEVPLIVPEANLNDLKDFKSGIISNPNCCTIPLSVVLKPLDNAAKIKRIIISTYQSVSGAGKAAMDELYKQTKAKFVFENIPARALPHQIAFNLFPQIGDFRDDGYSDEEYKIEHELKKVFGSHISASVTCVRVPVFVSHSMSVNVEFENKLDALEAEEILYEADSVTVHNINNQFKYATPVDAVENDEVFVSRIRNDLSNPNTLNMWICSDNLRKGAALNAVQIAEYVIKNI
ncbi:MAG: aspartate-semialdehyde dehydrogenase [Rickettsiales bacterium]|nr:MAG: aspartate-semialdehyde dehydrogenase [Rickettsiales bacterium]